MNLRILFFCFRKVFPHCFLLCLSALPLRCNVILDHCYFSFCFPGRNFFTKFDLQQVDAKIHQNCLQKGGLGKQHKRENSTKVADHRLKFEKKLWSRNELELSAFQVISIRGTISWSQAY